MMWNMFSSIDVLCPKLALAPKYEIQHFSFMIPRTVRAANNETKNDNINMVSKNFAPDKHSVLLSLK